VSDLRRVPPATPFTPERLMHRRHFAGIALLILAACQRGTPADRALGPGNGTRSADSLLVLERFAESRGGYAGYSGIASERRLLVRDAEAWASLWAEIHRNLSPTPPLPAVDFEREMVVAAALGTRPSGGYGITIDSARHRGDVLEIHVRQWRPGGDCAVTAALTAPVDLVRLPAVSAKAAFREESQVLDCGT